MNLLVHDSRYFAQVSGLLFRGGLDADSGSQSFLDNVRDTVSSLLGIEYPLRWDRLDAHVDERSVYDTLSELFPMSSQLSFFWEKFAKPFASMLETATFPLNLQCRFLTFVYARILGMMGPHNEMAQGSLMTFDGSPVELSWVIPRSGREEKIKNRQIRFAIEPIDPRTGELLCGSDVLDYLVSPSGSLGLVNCQEDGMAWRKTVEEFLFPQMVRSKIPVGSRFFVGFDFGSSGLITLKAYYIPSPKVTLGIRNVNAQQNEALRLWDSDWSRLRRLAQQLHPSLSTPLEKLISFVDSLPEPSKPRIQILAVDCVSSNANRIKIYCRPGKGVSWADACRMFTLGGMISSPSMSDTLAHLEVLWNNLFPSYGSTSGRQLGLPPNADARHRARLRKHDTQHPAGGLLYYFSLHAGVNIPLPKIYLPVSRYCRNDLQICNAVEQVYKINHRHRNPELGGIRNGWVVREVSKAFDRRNLKAHTGIHTYVTLAYKEKGCEITSYFSPEIWS